VPAALRTFAEAVASLRAAGNLVDELSSTVVLADMWLAAGRPRTARELLRRALELARARGAPRATADLHVGLSELDREAGDLDGARDHLAAAAALGEHAATTEGGFRWHLARGLLAAADGDPDGAVGFLDRAEQRHRPGFLPDVRPIPAVRARVRIGQGRLPEAAGWAREHGVLTDDAAAYLREFDHLTVARLLIAQHRARPDAAAIAGAVDLLDRLGVAADAAGRAGSLVEIHLVQALAHDARGDRPRAVEALGRAWAAAPEPAGYARLFLDEGAPMTELLHAAERHGVAVDHVRRVLATTTTTTTTTTTAAALLTDRELQVLGLLAGELSGPQIARELYVSHNTLRTHTKHIFAKLGVTSRRAAVRAAQERGVLQPRSHPAGHITG
jgi:LuxR family maltose regulon positive regulatory protein